jgi:glycosyltransferase involved in cell wall biosynthesis
MGDQAPDIQAERTPAVSPKGHPRVCFLTHSVSRNAGGLYESVRGLAHSALAHEQLVTVLGVADEHTAADLAAWQPAAAHACRVYGPERFSYAPDLNQQLRDAHPDLLHLHGLWRYPSIVTTRWHRQTGRPYVVHPHGMLDPWAVGNAHLKKVVAGALYENRMLRGATCIRALCQSEAESIRQYGLTNPICVIPNGIHPPKGPYGEAPWRGLIPAGAKVLFYLGRVHPKKGLPNLLKAWAMLQRAEVSSCALRASEDGREQKSEGRGQGAEISGQGGAGKATTSDLRPLTSDLSSPPWVLAIAGWDEGGHEDELKKLATELGLAWTDIRSPAVLRSLGVGGVLFLGPQFGPAKAACYHHCDAFILPSFSEGLPMVILEAWSHAKPVVMTPECNLPEGFAAGAAVRIEPNPESVLEGLTQLTKLTPDELGAMGQSGLRLVEQKFTWHRIGEDLDRVTEWILHGAPAPSCVIPAGQ